LDLPPENVFDQIKLMIASRVLLNYPDPNQHYYNVKPDASNDQLGVIIKHTGIPIVFFSHKLTNYTAIKKEICSPALKYISFLKGDVICIHTDHTNISYKNLHAKQVCNWCTTIEELCPNFNYKAIKE
jgi:hypothetical protein